MNLDVKLVPGMNIPMILAPTMPLLHVLQQYHGELMQQLNQHGAILFRGFGCTTAEHFSEAITLCNLGNRCSTQDYKISRTHLPNELYTSSDLPANMVLPLHHEKPRSKTPPHHIYFCCITPPQQHGGTMLADAAAVWMDMPKTIQDKISEHGILYQQFFHGNTLKQRILKKMLDQNNVSQWSDYFATKDKTQIEARLSKDEVRWHWLNQNNDLLVLNNLPGVTEHPVSKQKLWFNCAGYLNYYTNLLYKDLKHLSMSKYLTTRYLIAKDMLPLVCHYGNGEPFSEEEIEEINRVLHIHTHILNWQEGDFMVVDNYAFMHGKQAHQGKRLLYSCMTG